MAKSKSVILVLLVILGFCGSAFAEDIIYVDADATGTGTGLSWANAYKFLQDGLAIADTNDEIRMAQGIYTPDSSSSNPSGTGDRDATFQLINEVTLKGGYAGYGEPDPDARDIELYETILSGDLNGNDEPFTYPTTLLTEPTRADNSYHVVSADFGINLTAVLDGFIITDGNANGSFQDAAGGGMCIEEYSSPTVLNCTFTGNSAINGGGMFIEEGGTSIIKNCIFTRNTANTGGGLYGEDECDFKLVNCIFSKNMADYGGGMYNYGGDISRQTLTNCIFYANWARHYGSAIHNTRHSRSTLTNCIIWFNSNIYRNRSESSQISAYNSGCIDINYSCIERMTGALGGTGNIDANPLFVYPTGPDGIVGTQDDDWRLSADSLCIDSGDNSAVTTETDISGNTRIVGTVDMGAYEYQGAHIILYVDADAAGDNSGQSWNDAYTSLVEALKNTTYPAEIRVAQGTYRPNDGVLSVPELDQKELTFELNNGLTVKGGYAGFGEPEPDARDIELYETILSGDLAANDVPVANPADLLTEPTRGENCYNVVTTNGVVILNGVTITAGKAHGHDHFDIGGGLLIRNGEPIITNCSIINNTAVYGGGLNCYGGDGFTLVGCKFIGNSSIHGGGGLNASSDNAVISDCLFDSNFTGLDGGGMRVFGYDVYIANCTFRNNQADDGGGLYNDDECGYYATSCLFTGNRANQKGGGVYIGYITRNSLIGCTITGNSAGDVGGGIYNQYNPTITNTIIWGNSDSSGSGESSQIYGDTPDGGTLVVSYSCIQDNVPGDGSIPFGGLSNANIDTDPLFVDPNGSDGIVGTEDDDLRLSADSLCIDSGDSSVVTVGTDLGGNARIVNNFVDMGAYEFQGVHEIYVDDDAVGDPSPGDLLISDPDENGTAAHPFDTIQEAVDTAKDGHAVLVLPGLYVGPDIITPAVSFDKNITLTSIYPTDWDIVEDTIIAGSVSFSGTEDPTCKLTGFKIQNSLAGSINGNGTQAAISNCIITGNGPCLATVLNDCDGIISNCLVTDNTTFAYCGVFPVVFGCNGVIRNCTIANNISGIGDWSGGSTTLENCIVYNNGEGLDPQVSIFDGGTLDVSCCNIQGGLQGIDSDGAVNWGWGNIDVDSQFVRGGLWDYDALELAEGNYHLQSLGWRLSEYDSDWTYDLVTSRCIDAGNSGAPLADELMSVPRDLDNNFGINLRVNMGAYGGTAQASMAPYNWALLGDLSNNGTVAHEDLVGQAEGWLTIASLQPGDLNRDGIVNMADFAALARDWLQQTDWAQ